MRDCFLAALLLPALAAGAGDSLLPQLTLEQNAEAARIVASFKKDTRGPFYRIRWYCKDGTDWPPNPYPCGERGGGFQHASLNDDAKKLEEWNIDVGVILAGLEFNKFLDIDRDHALLKELTIENYLERIDNGWIYRRAYGYRGARQIEDEEKAGQALLARAFADPGWLERRLLLANGLITAVPHGLPGSTVKRVRDLAKAVADEDPGFQALRAKIHSAPDERDVEAVEGYLATRNPPEAVAKIIRQLALLMRQEGASRKLSDRLPSLRKAAPDGSYSHALEAFAEALEKADPRKAYIAGGRLSYEIAREVSRSTDGKRNLDLLDFNALVQEYGFEMPVADAGLTRLDRLELLDTDLRYALGAGFISERQFDALQTARESLAGHEFATAQDYFDKVRYLARASEWCRATAVREFGPVSSRFGGFEPLAFGFVDDVLRGSPVLILSRRLDGLMTDAAREAGLEHSIFGSTRSGGVFGLNPGWAQGRLMILDPASSEPIDQTAIYVIPESAADLKPMAGMLTLDSGNALSHAQLLAANLGIPNAVIPSSLLPELQQRQGERIEFSVSRAGEVRLSPAPAKTESTTTANRVRLDTSRLNLSMRKLVALSDLGRDDSGVIVGPKAANVGQLAKDFPEYVAPGFAIPFGIFAEHIDRKLLNGEPSLREEIRAALAEAARRRQAGASPVDVAEYIYPELAKIRDRIRRIPLLPDFEKELKAELLEHFGPDGSYGVFVRSDTNAEDLPQFSGAGLNLTVPNVVGYDKIVQAIKNVWASPFEERAFDWRSRILENQEDVYPSILMLRTVRSDKSGVLVTVNLENGSMGDITVNVNEGVSAVVDGGTAESLLLESNGGVRLLQQARSPYRKIVDPQGGFKFVAPVGADHVLADADIVKLRAMVKTINERYPKAKRADGAPLPWDIEFGFEGGELRLFQIRPLVRAVTPSEIVRQGKVDLTQVPGA